MNLLRLLLASSTLALLPACMEPVTPPLANPAPPGKPGLTATWKPAPGVGFSQLAATSAGEEGAIAYREYDRTTDPANPRSRVMLQRLDASGIVKGPVVEMSSTDSPTLDSLALASDGSKYLACWEQAGQTSCATAPVGEGPATAALTVAGSSPALAHGPAGFALAYGVSGHVAFARLSSDGLLLGAPVLVAVDTDAAAPLQLAANKGGFALLRGWVDQEAAATHLHALDSAFAPVGEPLDLGNPFARRGVLVSAGTGFADRRGGSGARPLRRWLSRGAGASWQYVRRRDGGLPGRGDRGRAGGAAVGERWGESSAAGSAGSRLPTSPEGATMRAATALAMMAFGCGGCALDASETGDDEPAIEAVEEAVASRSRSRGRRGAQASR